MKDPCEVSKPAPGKGRGMLPAAALEWAVRYVLAESPLEKLTWTLDSTQEKGRPAPVNVPDRPGRGAEFQLVKRAQKFPKAGALRAHEPRARALHTFVHHEVQAAELACRALVLFRKAEPEFRSGLLRIARDEVRHAGLYADHLEGLGFRYGDFAVRDWFWERGVQCTQPIQFVAFFGLGLEGANLEHTRRFAAAFREAGDEGAALIHEQIEREEIEHVCFSRKWFERWTDGSFEAWSRALPEPLTPSLFRSDPLNRKAREQAGQSSEFLRSLAAWRPIGS